jgi:regulator of sigma E protease
MGTTFVSSILNFAQYAIPFLIVLTVLVFVHELGHFLVGRYNKVKVEVFSIGFGPELFGWNDKLGTRWKFSLIPLGGYVKFAGDADASSRPDTEALEQMSAEEKSQTLQGKSVSQRIAISAAGPIANFLFAIIIMAGIYSIKGEPFIAATVGEIVPGKIAQKAGLQAGDKILSLNNVPAKDFFHLRTLLIDNKGKDVDLQYLRDNKEQTLHIKMVEKDDKGSEKPVGIIGVKPPQPEYIKINPLFAVSHAATDTWFLAANTLAGIGQMIVGKRSAEELGGIISIVDMSGKSAKGGILPLLLFMSMLSVSLGLLNLFPIPVLDGGHILFCAIEGIRGKPVPEKVQEYAFMVGIAIVLGVMLMSTWNDIVRLILK